MIEDYDVGYSELKLGTPTTSLSLHVLRHWIVLAETSSSAIAERSRCRVDQFWPKVEDDILQTSCIYLSSITVT